MTEQQSTCTWYTLRGHVIFGVPPRDQALVTVIDLDPPRVWL